jgi:hypothetical protein
MHARPGRQPEATRAPGTLSPILVVDDEPGGASGDAAVESARAAGRGLALEETKAAGIDRKTLHRLIAKYQRE